MHGFEALLAILNALLPDSQVLNWYKVRSFQVTPVHPVSRLSLGALHSSDVNIHPTEGG